MLHQHLFVGSAKDGTASILVLLLYRPNLTQLRQSVARQHVRISDLSDPFSYSVTVPRLKNGDIPLAHPSTGYASYGIAPSGEIKTAKDRNLF
jgi:hypothetical protein